MIGGHPSSITSYSSVSFEGGRPFVLAVRLGDDQRTDQGETEAGQECACRQRREVECADDRDKTERLGDEGGQREDYCDKGGGRLIHRMNSNQPNDQSQAVVGAPVGMSRVAHTLCCAYHLCASRTLEL